MLQHIKKPFKSPLSLPLWLQCLAMGFILFFFFLKYQNNQIDIHNPISYSQKIGVIHTWHYIGDSMLYYSARH